MTEPAPVVMIIDDDEQLLRLLARGIQRQGLEVLEAVSAEEALDRLKGNEPKPDVIISDIVMPGTDGLQFCRTMRSDQELKAIPILLLSCRSMVKDRVAGLEAGADDYMVKPFHLSELMARVWALHRRSIRWITGSPMEVSQTEPVVDQAEPPLVVPESSSVAQPASKGEEPATGIPRGDPASHEEADFADGDEHFRAGRYAEAFDIWSRLASLDPTNVKYKRWVGIARQNLMRRYDELFGSMDTQPVLDTKDPATLSGMDLSGKEGFILSRVDGTTTVRGLCQTSGLGKMDTLRVLHDLHAAGVIHLKRRKNPKRGKR